MILVQQRKQAKIGFETFRSKYIKLCVSSDVGKKEIRSERKKANMFPQTFEYEIFDPRVKYYK